MNYGTTVSNNNILPVPQGTGEYMSNTPMSMENTKLFSGRLESELSYMNESLLSKICGKVLTLLEATISSEVQLGALKDCVREIISDGYRHANLMNEEIADEIKGYLLKKEGKKYVYTKEYRLYKSTSDTNLFDGTILVEE